MPNILIVDDSPPIRRLMMDFLEQFGFSQFQEASNGDEALAISREALPDIITLDWNMPGMDGLEYLKELRKLPEGDKPIVIFCSTEGSAKKIQMVMDAGANEYITKPFDQHIIRETLEKLSLI